MRNGTAGSPHRSLAAGKQLEGTGAGAHSLIKPEPAASPELQPAKQEGAVEQPAAAKRYNAVQQRKPAAKRKAATVVKAEADPIAVDGQPAPAGVPELLGDAPLRLVLVGHNPSDHAWCAASNDRQAQQIDTLPIVACYHAKGPDRMQLAVNLRRHFIKSIHGGCRKSGHYYSNPTNWMWRLLKGTGIAPPHIRGAQVLLGLLASLSAGHRCLLGSTAGCCWTGDNELMLPLLAAFLS